MYYKDVRSEIKCFYKGFNLIGDKENITTSKEQKFLLFDPAICSDNIGDEIISAYCSKILENLGINIIKRIPTHVMPTAEDAALLQNYVTTGKFVAGTNVLLKHWFESDQWQCPSLDKRMSHLILMGLGLSDYHRSFDWATKRFYREFLDANYIHSVRDQPSCDALKSIGIKNVLNTACPSMWRLTPDFCAQIPVKKADAVAVTLTAYYHNVIDFSMLDILLAEYDAVYIWPQGDKDDAYIRQYPRFREIKLLAPTLQAFEDILGRGNIDYVGTRLHGGIYALNQKIRTLIIAVDERATSISLDTNLPIMPREAIPYMLRDYVRAERSTDITLPQKNIDTWCNQFRR